MGTYTCWTHCDVVQLRAMASAGLPLSVIARKLGRPRESVRRKAYHLGIEVATRKVRPFTAEEDAYLLTCGLTVEEMAEHLGRTKNSVYARLHRLKKEVRS